MVISGPVGQQFLPSRVVTLRVVLPPILPDSDMFVTHTCTRSWTAWLHDRCTHTHIHAYMCICKNHFHVLNSVTVVRTQLGETVASKQAALPYKKANSKTTSLYEKFFDSFQKVPLEYAALDSR